jgi:uncharacterized protein (TIGR03083 family)
MADISEVYDGIRRSLSELVLGLSTEELNRSVPATPGWTIKDVICHLTGDLAYASTGDFPREFFEAFGSPEGVKALNEWTDRMVAERRDLPLQEVLDEWAANFERVSAMLRGEQPWPEGIPYFADRVMVTDAGVHQQDVYGALGIEADRDGAPVRIGLSGYVVTMGFRMGGDGVAPLAFVTPEKTYLAGGEEPAVTVSASRFEFFRAMSGRRSPDQLRAYDWSGDPEPYLDYFYPYGLRDEALLE